MMASLLTSKPLYYNIMCIFYLVVRNIKILLKNMDNLYIFQFDVSKERKGYQLRFSENYAQKRLKSNFRN